MSKTIHAQTSLRPASAYTPDRAPTYADPHAGLTAEERDRVKLNELARWAAAGACVRRRAASVTPACGTATAPAYATPAPVTFPPAVTRHFAKALDARIARLCDALDAAHTPEEVRQTLRQHDAVLSTAYAALADALA